jgi:hypothetical protein
MQPEPFLIEKLDNKITWFKSNNQSFFRADGTFDGEDGNRLLQEYDHIKDNPRIPKPLRYTVLSVIAKEYNLYDNDQEPNRVSHATIDAIEESFTRSGNGGVEGIIIGLQILRNQYPLSYAASEPGLASSDGTGESLIEWLRNNGHYYSYGVQQIQRVNYFTAANNNAVMELKILEDANLYDSRGKLNKSKSGLEEKIIRYSFVLENGQLKISDYNIISKSKRKF